jgi:hypothetical protein
MAHTIGQRTTSLADTAKERLAGDGSRPQTQPWEDIVTALLATATLFAVFWDGWLHNNTGELDSFWSQAHIAMYGGLSALGAWIGLTFLRHQPKGRFEISLAVVPRGYGLALVALPLAALGGPGDFAWHAVYGFENQADAPFSPTHQLLFLSGALLGAMPLASAWWRAGRRPAISALWPAVLSMTAVVAMINFTFMNLLPWFWAVVPTTDFQQDLLRYDDAYAPGADIVHPEGLGQAVERLGDGPFPYYFFANMQSIAGVLIFSVVMVGSILYLRRRWVLPFGSLTLMFGLLGVLFPFFTAFRHPELIVGMIAAGVLLDLLQRALVSSEDPPATWRVRVFALLIPPVIWGCWLLAIALASGVGWNETVWTGVLSTTAGVGYGISLLVFPPALPGGGAIEEA